MNTPRLETLKKAPAVKVFTETKKGTVVYPSRILFSPHTDLNFNALRCEGRREIACVFEFYICLKSDGLTNPGIDKPQSYNSGLVLENLLLLKCQLCEMYLQIQSLFHTE
uniref:Uncharacterized protein n=1 Tax=Cacopsylla melanoneura TaxID=428564 RepID=A0A8D9BUR8_9HEMI